MEHCGAPDGSREPACTCVPLTARALGERIHTLTEFGCSDLLNTVGISTVADKRRKSYDGITQRREGFAHIIRMPVLQWRENLKPTPHSAWSRHVFYLLKI